MMNVTVQMSCESYNMCNRRKRLIDSGSDICTCRPYLIYGIEEAIKCAQRGGVGLIVYFRKEGRALGEVTKCTSSFLLFRPCHLGFGSLRSFPLYGSMADSQTWSTTPENEAVIPLTGTLRPRR
jgi:hypothetical protein